jgi:hypothetical protein
MGVPPAIQHWAERRSEVPIHPLHQSEAQALHWIQPPALESMQAAHLSRSVQCRRHP